MWDGPFLGKRDRGLVTGHLLDFCCEHDEQLSQAQCARGTRIWGFQPPHGGASSRHPRRLCGDVSCHCCVLTVPDSAGEAVEAASAPGAGGSWGLPVPAFSGSPFRQLPAGLQGTDFPFGRSRLCLCHEACRGKSRGVGEARLGLCIPWAGQEGHRPPSTVASRPAMPLGCNYR